MSNLQICSYNCKNVKSLVDEIRILCNSHDVVLLQETWLSSTILNVLADIDNIFYSTCISSMDTSTKLFKGRPFGGLGILWGKKLLVKIVQ